MGLCAFIRAVRIASLSPAVTEILFALGQEESIVCTDQFSNYPEEAKAIAHVRDHMNVCVDDLLPFEPDLVFTSTPVQQQLSHDLTARGLSVCHQDPRTLHDVYASIRSIGTMLDCEKPAADLVLSMQQGFNDVHKKAGLLPRKVKVYIEEWHDPPFASGNWAPEVALKAGVEQFPVLKGELSPKVTLEEVSAWDPDCIFISWCGAGCLADPALLTQRKGWGALRAVSEGSVYVIDDSLLNRPGPRLVDGARHLYGRVFELLH